ncbi:MAG: hypothetical protein HY868_07605 [Chloroflexi bacterium]|nr:hypothetical protein [Chloroflexota bacterium]
MKMIRMIAWSVLVLILSGLGARLVAAQGPDGMNPSTVPYIDNQPHPLAANASQWYRFDYGKSTDTGERAVATVRLVNGNNSGVVFEVWPPETVGNTTDNKPVGKGTAMMIDCATGKPSEQGECQTTDLSWSGGFGASGSYFVRVINKNNNPVSFTLTVEGVTVSTPPNPPAVTNPPVVTTPPPATNPPIIIIPPAVVAPPPGPVVISNADDPGRAAYIDNQPHALAANSAVWYRFDYSTNNDIGDRLTTGIRLIEGKDSGVRFEIWTPDMLTEWWTKEPVGRGTVSPADSKDLSWRGAFPAAGTYYVRVVNDNNFTTMFELVWQ